MDMCDLNSPLLLKLLPNSNVFFLTMTIINLTGIIIGMLRFEYAPCSARAVK